MYVPWLQANGGFDSTSPPGTFSLARFALCSASPPGTFSFERLALSEPPFVCSQGDTHKSIAFIGVYRESISTNNGVVLGHTQSFQVWVPLGLAGLKSSQDPGHRWNLGLAGLSPFRHPDTVGTGRTSVLSAPLVTWGPAGLSPFSCLLYTSPSPRD